MLNKIDGISSLMEFAVSQMVLQVKKLKLREATAYDCSASKKQG